MLLNKKIGSFYKMKIKYIIIKTITSVAGNPWHKMTLMTLKYHFEFYLSGEIIWLLQPKSYGTMHLFTFTLIMDK